MMKIELLQAFFDSDSHGNGHTDHGSRACPPPVAESRASAVSAAVEKIEETRKPDDFFGHRKRAIIRNLFADCHNTTTWSAQKVTSAKAEVTNAAI